MSRHGRMLVLRIGLPKEIKPSEDRVALTPAGAHQFVTHGHSVLVQTNAGLGSGFTDDEYRAAGASIVPEPGDAWAADLVVKVKEPQAVEYPYFRPHLCLFTYLHLAPEPELTHRLIDTRVDTVAYET